MLSVKKDIAQLYWIHELFPLDVTCMILEFAGLASFGKKSTFWVINF